jgi:putative membrane protein
VVGARDFPEAVEALQRLRTVNFFIVDLVGARLHVDGVMIANYTNHAANERTFLAWIRTGLAVAAFGFLLSRLNVFLGAASEAPPRVPAEATGAIVAVAGRHVGVALVAIGIAIIVRSGIGFERTRRAIDRDEVIRIAHSWTEPVFSAALAIAVAIFWIYLGLQQ